MKNFFKSAGFYIILFMIVLVVVMTSLGQQMPNKKNYSDLVRLIRAGEVVSLEISDTKASAKLKNNTKVDVDIYSVDRLYDDVGPAIDEQVMAQKLDVKIIVPPNYWWLSFLPTLVLIILVVVFYIYFVQQSQGGGRGGAMSFGKSRAKLSVGDAKTTFEDVAGADEEKEELEEIVQFLKEPSKFTQLGARIPKGVLLIGPPGTGKTLLAKAVAGEAKVPFFSISGSDFVEMFVGVGASRVRDLFDQAKKNAPSIVFIDEIDAVGRHRGAGLGGGHDEREQTLNQLLVEMDGFGLNEGVIIIAATNRPDILDPALLRPGRFDRQVVVGRPDVAGREAILRVHARKKPIGEDVDLTVLAKTTSGFTGADLENLLNEAALLAARKGHTQIHMGEIQDAVVKVMMGTEKKSRKVSDKERKLTAYHEAGHAIVTALIDSQNPVHEVSIIPRGMAGGYTMHLPAEDKQYMSRGEMLNEITILLAGRVAEKLVLDDISTGASNDLERSTGIARNMVTKYGMSDILGPLTFGSEQDEVFIGRVFGHTRNYSENIAAQIDEEIKRIVEENYERCQALLQANMNKLHRVAEALLEREKLDGDEFMRIFNGSDGEEASTNGADAAEASTDQTDVRTADADKLDAAEADVGGTDAAETDE